MVTGESHHLSVSHLFNPPCWLCQPVFPRDVKLRGSSIPVEAVPFRALLRRGLVLSLIKLRLEVLDELPGFGLFLELLPFSLPDCFNKALSHSAEYIGVVQVGLYKDGGRSRGHGGDRRLVGDRGAGEGRHALGAVGVVPGAGVVFAEVRMDEGVGFGEFVGEEEIELPKSLLGNELELSGPPWEVRAEGLSGLFGSEDSG